MHLVPLASYQDVAGMERALFHHVYFTCMGRQACPSIFWAFSLIHAYSSEPSRKPMVLTKLPPFLSGGRC
jgi:hypothetical protein